MLFGVALEGTEFSEKHVVSIIRLKGIVEIGK
jgi:hypothetical protein